ncbi:40S ribosomal protein S15 [Cryptosporidium felis]|nr:40S ribosomal protein S15 [Cryptosporidium felis]
MAETETKKRTFRTYSYRGVDLDKLLTMKLDEVVELLPARKRRKIARGCLNRRTAAFIAKLRKSKEECPMGEKPVAVRTHLRNMLILPEMVGSVAGVYNGKTYVTVEIKPEMIGMYLGEFSITYKPVRHGKPGVGSTSSSRFIPLK